MQENLITCDCCKELMDDENESELNGLLFSMDDPENSKEINMDDLCESCSTAISDAIKNVLVRKGPK